MKAKAILASVLATVVVSVTILAQTTPIPRRSLRTVPNSTDGTGTNAPAATNAAAASALHAVPVLPPPATPAARTNLTAGTNSTVAGATNTLPPPAIRRTQVPAAPPAFPTFPTTTPAASQARQTNAFFQLAAQQAQGTNKLSDSDPIGIDINFDSMPLDQFLTLYSKIVGRTILRQSTLPNTSITLKAASQLTRKEAIQAFESVLVVNGYTLVPMGEKFATLVVNNNALMEGAQFASVTDSAQLPESIQFVTHIVTLKHVHPSEVVPAIQPFARNPTGIVPIDSSSVLVLRDYSVNVKRMLEVIAKVDVQVEEVYKLEVIPIKFGKVEEIYSTMSSLISGQAGGAAGGVGATGAAARRTGAAGNRTGTAGGIGGAGGNRTGTAGGVNAFGGQNAVGGGAVQGGARNNSSFAANLQRVVNQAANGANMSLLGDARIVPDERSNSLIVFANKQDMEMITNIVAKVDVLLAQVLIEAIIVDVNLNDSRKVGVSGVQYTQKSGNITSGGGSVNTPPGANFLTDIIKTGSTNTLTSSLQPGFTYFSKFGGNFDATLQAVASDDRAQVLQTPRIQTTHAVPATFFSGKTVPYITSTYSGGVSGNSSSYSQLKVGVQLDVTPYITPDALVVMEISQTIDELAGSTPIQGVGDIPNTTSRSAVSTVSVKNHDTIMLGGFIRTSKDDTKSGIPYLKDIPLLGALFRSSSKTSERSELVVLMRPTIVESAHDAAELAKVQELKLPGVTRARREFQSQELDLIKENEAVEQAEQKALQKAQQKKK